MKLHKIGTTKVVSIPREVSLEDAARLMRENHVGDVVVVDVRDGKKFPVGILTDRDIVMATIALGAPVAPMLVDDIMTTEIATIEESESLNSVIDLMKDRGVKRVPLVAKEGELVGIIALEDVMKLLASELSALAEVGERQKEIEFRKRRKLT